jgi:5-formyltetrahydrofolate cyclo-ligase
MPLRSHNNATGNPDQARIRREALRARRALPASERELASLVICDYLIATPWFRQATAIGCYLALEDEVSTWSLIDCAWRRKKRIFVPIVGNNRRMQFVEFNKDSRLQQNRYGLQEPADGRPIRPMNLDLVIAPLVAFDDRGNRIGMGGGFYDCTFSFTRHRKIPFRPRLIGVAFACQQTQCIAANPWDVTLQEVLTENGPAVSSRR